MLKLEVDPYGNRSDSNPVMTLSNRNADKNGNTADDIVDAMFLFALRVRFRRRELSQTVIFSKLMNIVFENEGKMSLYGVVVAMDRGYGRMSVVE